MYHQRPARRRICILFALLSGALLQPGAFHTSVSAAGPTLVNPILFVTQPPLPGDFTSVNAVFGNHRGDMEATRGGDLWLRYPNGTLKNLTADAGFGSKDPTGFQGANAIAVRDPSVNWDGTKALFSMVIGAPALNEQYLYKDYYWQIYEVTNLGQVISSNATPIIQKLPRQPANFNNIYPIYGTDDRIIFVSDRTRNGARHLYPQRDEYEEAPTNTGLWSLNPSSGDLFQLDHAPSGDFSPIIDSFGRVIFIRWDHLQRDQQADSDLGNVAKNQPPGYGTFNYSDESTTATYTFNNRPEVFPEPRDSETEQLKGTNLLGHRMNVFFPWQVNEDGTDLETLNHVGRQEFGIYSTPSFNDDPNLTDQTAPHANQYPMSRDTILQMKEDPRTPGRYYGTMTYEFGSHAAGQILVLTGPATQNGDQVTLASITHPDTAFTDDTPGPNHSGLYRDPLPLSDGTVVVVHTASTQLDTNLGTRAAPKSRYAFRLKTLTTLANGSQGPGQLLTAGISKTVSYWDPDQKVTYTNQLLWELNPIEVRARTRPARRFTPVPAPELAVFAKVGVNQAQFQAYLTQHNLAVVVSRNVTTRDDGDYQQPFNLRVAGTNTQTVRKGSGNVGKIYDIAYMQFFQGDLIRGVGLQKSTDTPQPGRRVLAQPMHDPAAAPLNPLPNGAAAGSVAIGGDGSMAAYVPARRAMTWQLTNPAGVPVVRERLWVSFQPGEVRVCASCHGANQLDQAGHAPPTNQSEAFEELLRYWKIQQTGRKVYLPMAR